MAEQGNGPRLKLKAQVILGDSIAIGPGKADLLDAIARTGSIASAGRSLGFSYRRTRDMVEALNASWRAPLIETIKGGAGGGGSALTSAGKEVLLRYRALDRALRRTAARHADGLVGLLRRDNDHAE